MPTDTIPSRPAADPAEAYCPSDADIERAAGDIFDAFLAGDDRYGLEEYVAEIMVPLLVASVRSQDGGLELSPGSELFRRAARREVDGWDDAMWRAWKSRH